MQCQREACQIGGKSQGSAAARLRFGGILRDIYIGNFMPSVQVNEV